ncbi:MAG: amidohydrolase [Acidobacteriota bacterium]
MTTCRTSLSFLLLLLVTLPARAGEGPPADLILHGGFFYTVDPTRPSASAVAVRDGVLVLIGSDAEALALRGPRTHVLDLEGRMVMPGAHDSHVHILEAFHAAGGGCPLPTGLPLDDYVPIVSDCLPDGEASDWVLGFGHSIFDLRSEIEAGANPREALDAAVPDLPAAFLEGTSHSVWANSRALEAVGIDASTPDPTGGVILRDPMTGEPNGVLLDAAGELVFDLAFTPGPSLDDLNDSALLQGLEHANRHGITSLCDARCYWRRGYDTAWERARDAGQLTVRAVVGLWAYPYETDDDGQLTELIARYSNDPDSRLRFSQVKLYCDGEIEHNTAALHEPYEVDPTFFEGPLAGPRGLNYFDETRLTRYVTELEAAGFDAHVHAIGDRGVTEALNAIEAARIANGGTTTPRHRLTHVSLVDPDDVPRFAALDVTADIQPLEQNTFEWLYDIYLGPTVIPRKAQRLRDLHEAGVRVVLSSDFDVGDISPFAGMEAALRLRTQSLPDIDAAIRAYTIDAAYLMRQEDRVGSLEIGKLADLIVLDRNITTIPTTELSETQVLWTLLEGGEVWRDPAFCPPIPTSPSIRVRKDELGNAIVHWDQDVFAERWELLSNPLPSLPARMDFGLVATTTATEVTAPAAVDGPEGAFFLVDARNACDQASP